MLSVGPFLQPNLIVFRKHHGTRHIHLADVESNVDVDVVDADVTSREEGERCEFTTTTTTTTRVPSSSSTTNPEALYLPLAIEKSLPFLLISTSHDHDG